MYAKRFLDTCERHRFMMWSPVVPRGYLTTNLAKNKGLELVINGQYKQSIDELRALARTAAHETQYPAFRVLRILEHLRDDV